MRIQNLINKVKDIFAYIYITTKTFVHIYYKLINIQ